MRILNLFAGVGGNRAKWGNEHEITAVERDQQLAMIYLKRFPNDVVIVGDAYEYFLENFAKFDFIWASPPCQSHSWNTSMLVGYHYKGKSRRVQLPDLQLFSLIIFLKYQFRGLWIVENVDPYYSNELKSDNGINFLIIPNTRRGRHYYWCNFFIESTKEYKGIMGNMGTYASEKVVQKIANDRDIDLSLLKDLTQYKRNQTLRNMILSEEGKYILQCSIDNKKQLNIDSFL